MSEGTFSDFVARTMYSIRFPTARKQSQSIAFRIHKDNSHAVSSSLKHRYLNKLEFGQNVNF